MKFLLILLVVGIVHGIAEDVVEEQNDSDNEIAESASQSPVKSEEAIANKIGPAPTDSYGCCHIPWEYCLEESSSPECFQHPEFNDTLVCCNVTDLDKALQNVNHNVMWKNIHIHNLTAPELNISRPLFKTWQSIAVTNGQIKKIVGAFAKMSHPICLNFSNNSIFEIEKSAFSQHPKLKMLDLSNNNLTLTPNLINTSITVDLRGNPNVSCTSIFDTLKYSSAIKFIEPNRTFCLANKTYNWFNSTLNVPIVNINKMIQLEYGCPVIEVNGKNQSCTCSPGMQFSMESDILFSATVNCSGMGLTELPRKLPENTMCLDVSNNFITSLSQLKDNPESYFFLKWLYADNNSISSILELEGSQFLKNFQFLHLRRNRIRRIPIYLLNNALDKTEEKKNILGDEKKIFLADNPLNCECNTVKVLKLFLESNQNHIPEYNSITCDNLPQKIAELDVSKLCQSQDNHDFVYYIYYVIALEVFLLVALILKVSYDYWVFKTTGFLPCPASTILLSRIETAHSKTGFQKTT